MRDNFYVKLFNKADWYVMEVNDTGPDGWVAQCHDKDMAHRICNLLNGNK
jgi:hypothetical protein